MIILYAYMFFCVILTAVPFAAIITYIIYIIIISLPIS